MKLHANAPLSPKGRQCLVDWIERESRPVQDVAESLGVSERTARKWLARYRAEGPVGLLDRPSSPNVVANRTDEQTIEAIAALRRLRVTRPGSAGGPCPAPCAGSRKPPRSGGGEARGPGPGGGG